MNNNKNNLSEKESSSETAIERGKKAIEANIEINKKDLNNQDVKKDEEKDAEQWRNEG